MGYSVPQRSQLRPKVKTTVSNKTLVMAISSLTIIMVALVLIFQFGDSRLAYANKSDAVTTLNQIKEEKGKEIPIVSNSGNMDFPAELAFYFVTPTDYSVDIKWATVSEYKNKFFCIEKSNNGSDFREIGRLEANGTTKSSHDYEYVDFETPGEVVFYRLKQVSENGTSSYVALEKAEPLSAQRSEPLFIENIGPEPFQKSFDIKYYSETAGSVCVELIDRNGNKIYKSYTNATKGYNTCRFINGDKLNEQEYVLRIANSVSVYEKKIKRKI